MLFRFALLALLACVAAFAPPATHLSSMVARTATPTMQFSNALGGLNDELRNEMQGLDDDDEVPMTKAGACTFPRALPFPARRNSAPHADCRAQR